MPKFRVTTIIDGDVTKETIEFPNEKVAADDIQVWLSDAVRDNMPVDPGSVFAAKVENDKGAEVYRASLEFRARRSAGASSRR
jgi:hypothetical protein